MHGQHVHQRRLQRFQRRAVRYAEFLPVFVPREAVDFIEQIAAKRNNAAVMRAFDMQVDNLQNWPAHVCSVVFDELRIARQDSFHSARLAHAGGADQTCRQLFMHLFLKGAVEHLLAGLLPGIGIPQVCRTLRRYRIAQHVALANQQIYRFKERIVPLRRHKQRRREVVQPRGILRAGGSGIRHLRHFGELLQYLPRPPLQIVRQSFNQRIVPVHFGCCGSVLCFLDNHLR